MLTDAKAEGAARPVWTAILVSFAVLLAGGHAYARCTSGSELTQMGGSLQVDLACRASRLGGSGTVCTPPATPACASGVYDEVATLVFGQAQVDAALGFSSRALACQRAIAVGAARFLERRLDERARGQRRALSARAMRLIRSACSRSVVEENASSQMLPRVGSECADLVGPPQSSLDGEGLERCVRASLERIVDDLAPEPLRPNVVVILTDDQRADSVGAMPTVSSLREEGLSFTNAFTTSPICTPSRVSFLTSRYPRNHGVTANAPVQFDDTDTLATWLAAAGYTNGLFGKYVNGTDVFGETVPPGWHDWHAFLGGAGGNFYGFRLNENGTFKTYGESRYSTDVLRGRLLTFLRAQAAKPFFAIFTPFAPHDPSEPARRHEDAFADWTPMHPPSWLEEDLSDKPSWVRFLKTIRGPDWPAQTDENHRQALQTLVAVDEAIAKVLEKLESLGLADNTVVVFTSDHGVHFGEHWSANKFTAYEEAIRIPYVLWHPGRIPAGETRDELALNLDLAPTIAALGGATPSPNADGMSLVPLLETGGAPWREDFLVESSGEIFVPPLEAVRTDRWKYVDLAGNGGIREELYDLAADPYELQNVAQNPGYAAKLAEMQGRLDALRQP